MTEASLSIILEAIMFTSGRSMSTDELSKIVNKSSDEVNSALSELQSRIKRRQDSALQLTEVSGRWIFEVRPSLSAHLPESFRPDTPQRLLPAAALIAYHQPMAQSQLVEMLGQRAYDHVRELANLGLIDRRRDGLTRRLTTTRRFAEYFGCPEVDYRAVRSWFRSEAAKAGLTSAQLAASLAPDEQMSITEFIDEDDSPESPQLDE